MNSDHSYLSGCLFGGKIHFNIHTNYEYLIHRIAILYTPNGPKLVSESTSLYTFCKEFLVKLNVMTGTFVDPLDNKVYNGPNTLFAVMSYHNQTDDKNRIYAILQNRENGRYYDYTIEFNNYWNSDFGTVSERNSADRVQVNYLFYHKYYKFIGVGNQSMKMFPVFQSKEPIGLDLKVTPF